MLLLKTEVEEARDTMEVEVNTQGKEVVFRILIIIVMEEVDIMDKEEEKTTSPQTISLSVSCMASLDILSIHAVIVLIFLSRKPD